MFLNSEDLCYSDKSREVSKGLEDRVVFCINISDRTSAFELDMRRAAIPYLASAEATVKKVAVK